MKKKINNKAVMAALALAVGVTQVNAAVNSSVFDLNELNNNTSLLAHGAEGACGEGKCGADKKEKAAEAKCGEGKCGADKKAKVKAKSAESKCGAEKKAGEGTCGAKKE